MKSTKARKNLEEDKGRLEELLTAIKKRIKEMRVELEKAPRETIELPNFGKVVVAHTDQQREREYDDARRAQNAFEYQIGKIEFLLSPGRGRPRLNPSQSQAAIRERTEAKGRKPSLKRLAIKHSGSKDPKEREKFAEALKKTIQRTNSSSQQMRSKKRE
jgi:hypothetical protein